MKRRLFNLLAAVSAVLCIAILVQFCTSYVSPGWFAVRHGNIAYNFISTHGDFLFQHAHVQYAPAAPGWSCASGPWLPGLGVAPPSSLYERIGLVDSVIRIPWDANSSIQATGRSFALPSWVILLAMSYLPVRFMILRARQRRVHAIHGFSVITSEAPINATGAPDGSPRGGDSGRGRPAAR